MTDFSIFYFSPICNFTSLHQNFSLLFPSDINGHMFDILDILISLSYHLVIHPGFLRYHNLLSQYPNHSHSPTFLLPSCLKNLHTKSSCRRHPHPTSYGIIIYTTATSSKMINQITYYSFIILLHLEISTYLHLNFILI